MNPTLPSPRFGEVAALAALGLLVVTLSVSPITNYDVFLHLKTGSVILETGHVPLTDDYSALARGRPFVAHEWLSEVLFRVIERGFGTKGFPALICLTSVVALLIAASLYGAARLLGASPVIAVPMLALAMVLAGARLHIAPHIFSYLMIAVVLLLLAGRRAGRRIPLWSFLPLQIVWANLHGGFLLGPAIVGLAAIGEAVESRLGRRGAAPPGQEARRLALLALAQVAVSLVNPYGVRLLLFPFQLMGSDFMKEIYEWRPPFGSTYAASYMARYYVAWIVLGAGAILGGVLVARRRRTAPSAGVFGLLLFVFFLALSLRMNRVVTDFALATCPWLASTLTCIAGGTPRRVFRESALFVTALALAGLAFWFGQNGYPFRPGDVRPFGFGITDNTPVLAADYLERNDVRGNIFNSYETGPYLIYRLYPRIRVAMDSRNDVYGEELYGEYKRALRDSAALGSLLQRLQASAVVLGWVGGRNLATARLLRQVGPWVPVAFDDAAIVYMRADGSRPDLVARDGYTLLDPARYAPGAFRADQADLAVLEAERAVSASREAFISRVMKMDALLAVGRREDALREEAQVLAGRPALPYIYVFLGDMRLALGDRQAAADRYRQALEMAPGWGRAVEGLQASLGRP